MEEGNFFFVFVTSPTTLGLLSFVFHRSHTSGLAHPQYFIKNNTTLLLFFHTFPHIMNTNATTSAVQALIGILEQRIVSVDSGSLDQHLELLCNQPIPTEYLPLCQQLGCKFPAPPVLLPPEVIAASSSSSSSSSSSDVVPMKVVKETTVKTTSTKANTPTTEAVVVTSNAGGDLDVPKISADTEEPPKKRGRGRPPKIPRPDATANISTAADAIPSMGSSSSEDINTAIHNNSHESPGIAADEKESMKSSFKSGKGSDSKAPIGNKASTTKDQTDTTSATKGGKKNTIEKEQDSTRDSTSGSGKKEKEEKGKSSARLSTSSTTSNTTTKTSATSSSKNDKGQKQSKEEEDDEPRRSKRGR